MNEVSVSDGNVMTRSSQTEMMISRQAQEVQAAMVIALKNKAADPTRCECCDYCKQTRVLKAPIWSSDLIGDI